MSVCCVVAVAFIDAFVVVVSVVAVVFAAAAVILRLLFSIVLSRSLLQLLFLSQLLSRMFSMLCHCIYDFWRSY
jgi:hypothetical protein